MITVRRLTGTALDEALEDVARLRIAVFADWPYLYDGDLAYEAQYLQMFSGSGRAVVIGAYDGDWLIGAATAAPLADHADDFAAACAGSDLDLHRICYCAESVLLPRYRGRGLGHKFFDHRESFAAEHGYEQVAFCSVVRPENHPARPDKYRSLEPFWRGRGYAPLPGVVAQFAWKDHGQTSETAKPLQFWMKSLS